MTFPRPIEISAIKDTGITEIKPVDINGELYWVIVGGGPSGLLTAFLLSKKKAGKITIIEPRLFGEYLRSGDYVNEVFIELSKELNIPLEEMLPSYANHIKDVEKILYTRIKALGTIEMLQGEFVDYSEQGVHVIINNTKHIIPCNVLMDCSGQNATVINKVNDHYQDKPVFVRKIIDQNPHPSHIHATISMDRTTAIPFYKGAGLSNANPLDKVNTKEEFKKLGWSHWANPYGYINPFGCFGLVKSEKTSLPNSKYHFYSEVPRNLEKKEEIPWIKAYMSATSGVKQDSFQVEFTHQSKKYPNKKKQSYIFDVIPRFTTPHFFVDQQRSIIIVPLGEASFNNIFYWGTRDFPSKKDKNRCSP